MYYILIFIENIVFKQNIGRNGNKSHLLSVIQPELSSRLWRQTKNHQNYFATY